MSNNIHRIAKITTAASLLAGVIGAAPAAATHMPPQPVQALENDVETLRQDAEKHVSQVRETASNTGSHTRSYVGRALKERTSSTRRVVDRTRRDAGARVRRTYGQARSTVKYSHGRVKSTRGYAEQRVKTTQAGVNQTRASAEAEAREKVAAAQQLSRETSRRIGLLRRDLHARLNKLATALGTSVPALLAQGSLSFVTTWGSWNVGLTQAGSCVNTWVATPVQVNSRTRRRTGASATTGMGQRATVMGGQDDASASSGC